MSRSYKGITQSPAGGFQIRTVSKAINKVELNKNNTFASHANFRALQ